MIKANFKAFRPRQLSVPRGKLTSKPALYHLVLVVLVAASGTSVAPAVAQESVSAPLAAELASLMMERQLEAVAGKDTADDDRYVAALFSPGQFLVVSARYAAPALAWQKITNREFRELYIDLNQASITGTKILITDTGANGLRADDDTIDMVDSGAGILRLDNKPTEQQLSREEYRSAVTDADEQYARMLGVLIAQANADSGGAAISQESISAPLAAELASLMTDRQLNAVASKDTVDDDRFAATLSFPGQLVAVSARYEVPFYIETKIANREFQEVYLDLNGASVAGTKIVITDAGANGLRANDDAVDMVDSGAGILILDGNPSEQQLSRTEYMNTVADGDKKYARILRALITKVLSLSPR